MATKPETPPATALQLHQCMWQGLQPSCPNFSGLTARPAIGKGFRGPGVLQTHFLALLLPGEGYAGAAGLEGGVW